MPEEQQWWCWRCKETVKALGAVQVYCAKGHALKKVDPQEVAS